MPTDALAMQERRRELARNCMGEDWETRYARPSDAVGKPPKPPLDANPAFDARECPECLEVFPTPRGCSQHHRKVHGRPLIRHGTNAGYHTHIRHEGQACRRCLLAHREYVRAGQ